MEPPACLVRFLVAANQRVASASSVSGEENLRRTDRWTGSVLDGAAATRGPSGKHKGQRHWRRWQQQLEPLTPEAVETAVVSGGPTPWPCPLCAVESGEPVLPAYGASITDLTCSRGAGSDESIGHSPVPAQGIAAAPDELGDRDLSFFHSNGPGSLHATRPRSYQWGNGWGPPGRPLDGTFHTRGRCSRPLFRCAHLMATW